jgi:fumarate hydratase class II
VRVAVCVAILPHVRLCVLRCGPCAVSVATAHEVHEGLVPSLRLLLDDLDKKSKDWENIVKIGRTHLMDAVPITLGQEFSGYAQQVRNSLLRAKAAMVHLLELAIGGTAVRPGIIQSDCSMIIV